MFRRFSVNFALFSMLVDAALVFAGLALATHLRPLLDFLPFAADYPSVIPTPWLVFPLFALEWILILFQFSLYDGRRHRRTIDELTSLTLGTLLASAALAGTLYLSYRQVSRLLFVLFVLLTYAGMVAWRVVIGWMRHTQRPRRIRQVLIVGAGTVGRELATQVSAHPSMGLHVAGFLDDDPLKRQQHADILGPLAHLKRLVPERGIDDVVIALPQRAYKRVNQLVAELHRLPVKVWLIPDYFRLALHKAAVEEFAGLPMLDLRAPALSDSQRLAKRAFDLTLTLLLLPPALLLMGLIALAVRLDSPGPAFFIQRRVGENGRLFRMIKFRSMVQHAEALRPAQEASESAEPALHKQPDDPRVTRLGRFLRRSSLDELPQIFNVLNGDMSLVGPRPELPELVDCYEDWQRQRFVVPQGITGWWQVNGRSDKPMHLHTEDDLYYIQNYSLLLDVFILLKTALVVFSGKGAF